MAGIARGPTCSHVPRWLSLRHRPVVTAGTGAWKYSVMRKECRRPIRRTMATVTIDTGRQMVRGFESRDDSSAWRVALHTLRGGSSKDSLQVASLALNLRVTTGEKEACSGVINFYVGADAALCGRSLRAKQRTK